MTRLLFVTVRRLLRIKPRNTTGSGYPAYMETGSGYCTETGSGYPTNTATGSGCTGTGIEPPSWDTFSQDQSNVNLKWEQGDTASSREVTPQIGSVFSFVHQTVHSALSPKRKVPVAARVDTTLTNFRCRICVKVFDTAQSLNRHMRVHNQNRCKQCNQCFKTEDLLQKHNEKLHTFKHPCSSCGKLFGRKFTLKRHEMYTCKVSTRN